MADRKTLRKAAQVAEFAAKTTPARVGRYYMEATKRAEESIRRHSLNLEVSPLIYGGIEGLASAAGAAIVRVNGLPREAQGPISGYVAEALYGLVSALVTDFDGENFEAWRRASRGEEMVGHDGDHGAGAGPAAHEGAREREPDPASEG